MRLIIIMGVSILVKQHLYDELAPGIKMNPKRNHTLATIIRNGETHQNIYKKNQKGKTDSNADEILRTKYFDKETMVLRYFPQFFQCDFFQPWWQLWVAGNPRRGSSGCGAARRLLQQRNLDKLSSMAVSALTSLKCPNITKHGRWILNMNEFLHNFSCIWADSSEMNRSIGIIWNGGFEGKTWPHFKYWTCSLGGQL